MSEDRSVLTRPSASPDAVVRYGDATEHVADVRYGGGDALSRPLLIMIHGGFWRPEYDRTHTGPMCAALAKDGWTVASTEYRRIPRQPDITLSDMALAVSKLPQLVDRHNGRAVAIGHSAGGHLALWIAARANNPSLSGVLALAPVADLALAHRLHLDGDAVTAFLGTTPEQRRDADPMQSPSPSMAVCIIHGEGDEIVPLSVSQSYVAAHPATRLVTVPHAAHFALIDPQQAAWNAVTNELRDFINR